MAAFARAAFFTDSFSEGAFEFDPVPVVPTAPTFPIGGGIPYVSPRSKKDISRARRRMGLEDDEYKKELAQQIVLEVAKRQAEQLQLDKQKQFEELSRELRINEIEWESSFLDKLNRERERLIDLEISARIKAKLKAQIKAQQQEDEDIMAVMMMLANL